MYRLSAVLYFLQIILDSPAHSGYCTIPVILSAKNGSDLFFKVFSVMGNNRYLVKKSDFSKNYKFTK